MKDHPSLAEIGHRPWPLPEGRWTWRQSWRDLLFAHWPAPAKILRPLVPAELAIQEFEGTSWIGVVPFRMTGVMRRPLPDLPWVSAFPELNVRVYVERDGRPGVWFLSLDAANVLAVWAARRFFHLPYFRALMSVQESGDEFAYRSERIGTDIGFVARYAPTGPVATSRPGTLAHFLTERYCLYARDRHGRFYRGEVHHPSWPLQPAHAEIDRNDLFRPFGLSLPDPPALLHFARRVDVVLWPFHSLAAGRDDGVASQSETPG